MSLAAETREAVRERPFVRDALRAGVLNHSAAAAWLVEEAEIDGTTEAVSAALRRFRDDLPAYETAARTATVSMRSGVEVAARDPADAGSPADGGGDPVGAADPIVSVGGTTVESGGRETAVLATGAVDAAALAAVLERLAAAGVDVSAAAVAGDALAVVVGRRDGATAVRTVEAALSAVPAEGTEP